MKISVATYSLTRLIRTGDMTLLGVVDWLAEQGIQGIEINGLEGYTKGSVAPLARSLSARIAKRGLTPTSYTVGANLLLLDDAARAQEVERLKKVVDLAARLGCDRVRHDVARGFPEGYRGRKTWDEALKYIAPACREVAEHAKQ